MFENNASSSQPESVSLQNTTVLTPASDLQNATPVSVQQVPVVEMTPAKSEVVTEVAPILTPDPYPILHGTRINGTPQYNPLDREADFEKNFHLSGNATGLLVNVVEGPLYIVYEVTPEYDCMMTPDSCRGTPLVTVNRPYMTITVRDNATQDIVAEDGYAREFSSDTGKYTFSVPAIDAGDPTKDTDPSAATTTTSPGPRYIAIYKEGVYHVTIEGNYLDVDIKILTGDMPTKLDAGNGDVSSPTGSGSGSPPADDWE